MKPKVDGPIGEQIRNVASNWIALSKDSMALLRDLALAVLAVLLLVFPTQFNTMLTSAGFEEGSLVGLKWKSKLVDSDAALKDALATIADLKTQLDKTSDALQDAQAQLSDSSLKSKLAQVQSENKRLNDATSSVEASVSRTIASSAVLVDKAQDSERSSADWAVVFGGDTSLSSAQHEAQTEAPKLGIPNARIYLRQRSYRTVSILASKSDADHVLAKAKQRRLDAYIVNLSKWCPAAEERAGYWECLAR